MSIVSENIKYLRRVNGLTQEQFARRIGIKRSLLGAYEEARANPNLSNLMNIAKIFGTSVDNLIKNDIRKLRESQSIPLPQPSMQLLADEPARPAVSSSQSIASIVEKYYQDTARDVRGIQLVAQRIAPKRVTPLAPEPALTQILIQPEKPRTLSAEIPANVAPPVLNKAYTTGNRPPVGPAGVPAKPVEEKLVTGIELVRQAQTAEYLLNHTHPSYLRRLPVFHLPWLPEGTYRAFEIGDDFAFPGAVVVGQRIEDWYDLKDGLPYVVVLHQKGILYRRVYNQVKIKGVLLLSSDKAHMPSFEVSIKEALEVWEVKAFVSTQLPQPNVSLERLTQLVTDLQQELERLSQ